MSFDSLSAFWAMGGYAAFVWPSIAISAVVLVALVLSPLRQHRRLQQELTRLERQRQRPSRSSS